MDVYIGWKIPVTSAYHLQNLGNFKDYELKETGWWFFALPL